MNRPRVWRVFRLNVRRWAVVALVANAFAATLLVYLTTASAGPPPPALVDFSTVHKRPVAGEVFRGLAIINRSGLVGTPERFSSVRCDGEIAGKRLQARRLVFGEPRRGYVQVVVCGWRIPTAAAGQKLRLWDYGGGPFEHRAFVQLGITTEGSEEFVWGVKKP